MEPLSTEPGGTGVGVDARCDVDQLRPRRGGLDIDLEDARVGGDEELDQPGVEGWEVTLEDDGPPELDSGVLDYPDQLDELLETFDGGQENEQAALPRLDTQRPPRHVLGFDLVDLAASAGLPTSQRGQVVERREIRVVLRRLGAT